MYVKKITESAAFKYCGRGTKCILNIRINFSYFNSNITVSTHVYRGMDDIDDGAVPGDTVEDEDIVESPDNTEGIAEEDFIPGFATFEAYSKVLGRINYEV